MTSSSSKSAVIALTFDNYNSQLQLAILKATKNAAALPGDVGFYTSMDKNLAQEVDACSTRVLALTNKMLTLVATGETSTAKSRKRTRRLENVEDVVDNFRSTVIDSMDQLLERADMRIDDVKGLNKPPAIAVATDETQQKLVKSGRRAPHGRLDPGIQNASHLHKPQIQFKRKVDNANHSLWQPSLRHKYNAQVPQGYRMSDAGGDGFLVTSSHPYLYEIQHINYPSHMFRYAEPIPPKTNEATPFVWVDTSALLSELLNKLRTVTEIAIDLEHHSYRTYAGFVCLMQISTRDCDYIVDTLKLRDELEDLNEVFTDPKIVKVFHGAESDIVWLQQDFNLYVVNLFDTYHASKVLTFPRHALATLLEMYCDFTPDKRYQLADWRIRPLPEEMLAYARSDTHYLLYIYDNLRNALLDRSGSRAHTPSDPSTSSGDPNPSATLLREVLSRSQETSLRTYEKELYDAETGTGFGGWDALAKKWNRSFLTVTDTRSNQRLEIYKAVHAWRDRVARLEDESTRYVLPNHYLFSLAEQPPADMAALHSLFSSVPPIVRVRGKQLLDSIRDRMTQLSAVVAEPMVEDAQEEAKQLGIVSSADTADVQAVKNPAANIFAPMSQYRADYAPSAQFSALFGSASNMDRNATHSGVFSAGRSTLFNFDRVATLSTSKRNKFAIRDVLLRIHSDLTVTPAMPKAETTTGDADHAMVLAPGAAQDFVSAPAEMAFVPAEKRQSAVPTVDDTIVVVGQKKRKRAQKISKMSQFANLPEPRTMHSEDSTPNLAIIEDGNETGVNTAVDTAPFDFEASGSNILDNGADQEVDDSSSRKKKRKGQTGIFEYGNFKAPPKAHSQLQQGNVSRTFK